jgi:hypothetical protein
MAISQQVHDTGQQVAAATRAALADTLNTGIQRLVGWPYKTASGCIIDLNGLKTETFSTVVYTIPSGSTAVDCGAIPSDTVAAVIDASESIDADSFRSAYARIALAKRLKKSPAPLLKGALSTTVTLGIIFAQRSDLPLENFADELERLNAQTSSREWPDMIVVASTGAINYAVQFPGESISGDYLPPAEGALANYTPPMYVVMVMRPTGAYTFNKMTALLIGHLSIFSPGARLPNFNHVLEGVPQIAITLSGYQYNLGGELVPVPRQFYNDRYLPPPPMRIEDQKDELLSTIEFLPWQDGGVILLKGKLPLDGLLVFLGKDALQKAGIIRRPSDLQISHVLPIAASNFNEMLNRFQRQSNMVVRQSERTGVIQKIANEGSTSPFMARLFIGLLRLRDVVFSDPAKRDKFDKPFEQVFNPLMNARATEKDIIDLWEAHARKVASGEIARRQGQMLQIDESIDKELRRQVESFLNTAVRALKQGTQSLATELQVDISFMFKQQGTFDNGIEALQATDLRLAEYLRQTRVWSERLVQSRNDIEHTGWTLPRVHYQDSNSGITAVEPEVSGLPMTAFVKFILDRLCCFVEECTAHCFQKRMPSEITIAEIPPAKRLTEVPERFILTLGSGGLARWNIAYHASSFEET